MIRSWIHLGAVLVLAATLTACATSRQTPARTDTVLAIDFMRTLPGEQADYLEFVRLNWMQARAAAVEVGAVVRYEVLTREPTADAWDVMLITEYASSSAHAAREETFTQLFERPELAMTRVNGRGPRDMAAFVGSNISVTRVSL